MDLAQLTDAPTIVNVGGKDYAFSELTLASMGKLQGWIKSNFPHPLEAIKPHLEGFAAADRAYMIEAAQREAAYWPPAIGTPRASACLLTSPQGQTQVLYEGLKVHDPAATIEDADRLRRLLKRDEAKSLMVIGLIFGTYDPGDDEAPKDPGAAK
jgi:hypothetical protein